MVVRAREGSVSRGKVCNICVFLLLSSFSSLLELVARHVSVGSPHWPDVLVCSLRFAATVPGTYWNTSGPGSCSSSCCTVGLALGSVSECKDGLSAVSKL